MLPFGLILLGNGQLSYISAVTSRPQSGPSLAAQNVAIVLRGQFNPAIITPGWLLAQGLIGTKEALDVQTQVIVNDFSQFRVSWLTCQVTEDEFVVSTDEPAEFERLRDVILGVFSVLRHTPIGALGINRSFHYQMPSPNDWWDVSDSLVPKGAWDKLLELADLESLIVSGSRTDSYDGRVQVKVEPSYLEESGLFVSVNDHYVLRLVDQQPLTRGEVSKRRQPPDLEPSSDRIETALEILTKNWLNSVDSAERIALEIVHLRKG